MARPRMPDQDRYVVDPVSGCWMWVGSIAENGYSHMSDPSRPGKIIKGHRYFWAKENGPIPPGVQLDHECHNIAASLGLCRGGFSCLHRRCVNPSHLRPSTHQENCLRGLGPAADGARRTHCVKGHPLSGDNLYPTARQRQCRECHKVANRASAARRRSAVKQ